MTDWVDNVDEPHPNLGMGDLTEGDELRVRFTDDGTMKDTQYGTALKIGVELKDAPGGFTDMNDEPVESGEEYYIMTSSTRLQNALIEFGGLRSGGSLQGRLATVSVTGDNYERDYRVVE